MLNNLKLVVNEWQQQELGFINTNHYTQVLVVVTIIIMLKLCIHHVPVIVLTILLVFYPSILLYHWSFHC